MSRWLWALLGGVVLVAVAAVFWTASNWTNVSPPVSPEPTAVAPAPVPPAPPAPAPVVHERASSPAAPAVQQATTPPAPAPPPAPGAPPAPPIVQPAPAPLQAAPNAAPNPAQQAASPPALAPRPSTSSAPPVVAKEAPSAAAPLAEPPLPQPAPGRETQEVAGVFAPKNLAQLVGAWAYSEGDCDRLFQRRGGGWAFRQPVDKFAQAAIVESSKKILLPSAICRIEGASSVEGMLKVSADCEDSISYTPRSVMIALRSPTELLYSATGDPVLATTLKKCAP